MILLVIVSAIPIGILLGFAADTAERALRHLGCPTRFLWLGAMLGTVALPLLLLPAQRMGGVHFSHRFGAPSLSGSALDLGSLLPIELMGPHTQTLERVAGVAWLAATAILSLGLVGVVIRSRRDLRQWGLTVVDGVPVHLSERFGPAVIGFRRARIVIPKWVTALPTAERRLVLNHEQDHLRAGDTRTLGVGTFFLLVMPWNVGLWWQLHRFRISVEIDCDRRVLGGGLEKSVYAEFLIRLHERTAARRPSPLSLAGAGSQLGRRIDVMTRRPTRHRILRASLNGVLTVSLVFLALGCTLVGAQRQPSFAATHGAVFPASSRPRPIYLTSDTGPPLLYVVSGRLYRSWEIDLDTIRVASARLTKSDQLVKRYGTEARNGVAYLNLKVP